VTDTDLPVFTGWPTDATAFLAELADDNTRGFWTENVHRYRCAAWQPRISCQPFMAPPLMACT